MGNEKLWVEWPNPKDGYELQPLYQKCKKYMKTAWNRKVLCNFQS